MLDFRKQFQEIIEQSYIPFNIDKAATSDVWSNIYKLILPNIPEKLFRYRKIDDKGYTIESLKSGTISLCHAGMFPDKYDSYLQNSRRFKKVIKGCIAHNIVAYNPEIL